MHDRTRRPSMCTVHAPHSPLSHDFLGPVKPNSSRKTSSRVVRGSTAKLRTTPLTFMLTRTVSAWFVWVPIILSPLLAAISADVYLAPGGSKFRDHPVAREQCQKSWSCSPPSA